MRLDEEARRYANAVFERRTQEMIRPVSEALSQLDASFAKRGLFFSGPRIRAIAKTRTQLVEHIIRARLESLLEAYERAVIPLTTEVFDEIHSLVRKEYEEQLKLMEGEIHRVVDKFERPEGLRKSSSSLVNEYMAHAWDRVHGEWQVRRAGAVLDARKQPIPDTKPGREGSVVNNYYNVTGANARINIDSADHSVNIQNVSQAELFNSLREAMQRDIPQDRLAEVLEAIGALENAIGTESSLRAYQRVIGVVADHIALLQPFLPALTQLLM